MRALSHPLAALSIAAMLLGSVAVHARMAAPSPYFGRWTVDDATKKFSSKGRPYKTIDIAPCGKDFCGVSVDDKGKCGPVLFRFLTKNARAPVLQGHGRWGSAKKKIQIQTWETDLDPGGWQMELYLGDNYDFGERSESMPKYYGSYKRTGNARCTAR